MNKGRGIKSHKKATHLNTGPKDAHAKAACVKSAQLKLAHVMSAWPKSAWPKVAYAKGAGSERNMQNLAQPSPKACLKPARIRRLHASTLWVSTLHPSTLHLSTLRGRISWVLHN